MSAQMLERDTVISKVKYHYLSYYSTGKLKTVSETKVETKKGRWIYFDEKGNEEYRGRYNRKGQKDGKWWYRKSEFSIYKKGKVVKMGKGCLDCPGF